MEDQGLELEGLEKKHRIFGYLGSRDCRLGRKEGTGKRGRGRTQKRQLTEGKTGFSGLTFA